MNALVYVDIDWGIHKVKLKNALNEKQKKLGGFSFSIDSTANFEAFRRTKKLISNLLFLKSVGPSMLKSRYRFCRAILLITFHFTEGG